MSGAVPAPNGGQAAKARGPDPTSVVPLLAAGNAGALEHVFGPALRGHDVRAAGLSTTLGLPVPDLG